ncbi:VOC family protein [Flavobacterium sp.]|mgnify:CR=1 FL=1|uniref:VOC family protein n=1 Tax=Flavobacterium sp. TaxID=239 RepID=UPI002FDB57A2
MNQNVICWFEIYVDNMDRAKQFYATVLGTQFHDMQAPGGSDEFIMSCFSNAENQGVSGALVQMKEARVNNPGNTSTMVYFPCEDCSVEESRVEKAGGKVYCSKMAIGEHGFISMCLDTENNTFGLYSMQ